MIFGQQLSLQFALVHLNVKYDVNIWRGYSLSKVHTRMEGGMQPRVALYI